MKKLFALLFILIIIDVVIVSVDSKSLNARIANNEINAPKDDIWERVKIQVYGNGIKKEKTLAKYKGPILFKLENATSKDSLAFNNVLQELNALLPHLETDYFSTYTKQGKRLIDSLGNTIGRTKTTQIAPGSINDTIINGYALRFLKRFTIKFTFFDYPDTMGAINNSKHKAAQSDNGISVKDTFYNTLSISKSSQSKDLSGFVDPRITFNFTHSVSVEERMRMLKNVAFKLLSFNSFHIYEDYLINKISNSDELIMQRFYSPTFETDFKAYMNDVYGWRYSNYFLNKERYISQVVLFTIAVGILLFVLAFGFFYNRTFRYPFLYYYLPALAFWICYIELQWVYDYFTDFDRSFNIVNVIGFQLIALPLFALITALVLWGLDKLTIRNKANLGITLGLYAINTFIAFMAPVVIVYFTKSNYENIYDFFLPLLYVVIGVSIGRSLLVYLNYLSDSLINQKDVELSQIKEANAQAQVKLLQSQINPHFLYNSLNSIACLAPIDGVKAQFMAQALSKLFKYNINRGNRKMSTIGEEVDMVKHYLYIEQIRFGDRLNFNIDVDETLLKTQIPQSVIQPLVENAVKHGLSKIEDKGYIGLQIKSDSEGIIIKVTDNGPDFPEGLLSGHGLQSVFDLLRLTYGNKANLNWTNIPEKAITIHIS